MYTHVDVVGIAEASAALYVQKDRDRYLDVLTTIENFIYQHKCIITGESAHLLFLKKNIYLYEFYSNNVAEHSKALATLLYKLDPEYLTRYTVLITKIPNHWYVINVDQREFVRLYAIPAVKQHLPIPILPFYCTSALTHQELFCLGPELQLIQIYSKLCNPNFVEEWPTLLDYEKSMRMLFLEQFPRRLEIAGGKKEEEKHESIIKKIILEMVSTRQRIVVGGYIQKNLYNHVLKNKNRLQLITSLDIYEEKDIIQQFCDSNGLKIKIRINNPLLPTNPELRRLTIYFNHNNDDDQSYLIVDMYNTGSYELVPTNQINTLDGSFLIGTPFVQARFLLVEIWVLMLIAQQTKKDTKKIIQFFINQYEMLMNSPWPSMEALFPSSSKRYLGNYVDPNALIKWAQLKLKRIPPFYPGKPDEESC
ncbi:pK421R [African swine fever virus]|uniref:K421R n=2 Tax=African swine fever virus TaxID=10497 RepID=A0A1C6ZXZ1_ASF|nr:K421R [African swine fever virus]YP_009703295.1 pK421R [African swine fever virus]YP_009703505.1 pK421R [African swine fever virus Benin 97/1]AJZ77073.1 K421R [African swine fever virus]AOO54383.1 pK421R [African swine fever virus]QIM06719.1 pK421R [African swine fever virus]QIM06954.1 pK421R [African swine fever virus]QIM07189.1 pK421R [African swine fever virus]